MIKTIFDGKEEELLVVHLKSPKEDALKLGVNVEIFGTGTFTCPVDAWHKWQKIKGNRREAMKPLFRQPGGRCMTGAEFNRVLKSLLGNILTMTKADS